MQSAVEMGQCQGKRGNSALREVGEWCLEKVVQCLDKSGKAMEKVGQS